MNSTASWLSLGMVLGLIGQAAYGQASHVGIHVDDFTLQDMKGESVKYSALKGNVTVLVFLSTRCPMSNAFNFRINELYNQFKDRARFIIIHSNANETLDEVRQHAKNMEYDFPVYRDVDNIAADLLRVQVTPESVVIDQKSMVEYFGNIEDSPNPERTKSHSLRQAIEAVLQGRAVEIPETHSLGCSIRRARKSVD